MEPREAVHAHLTWVADLWDRIYNGDSIDPEETGADDRCALGRWLHGDMAAYREEPAYRRLMELHVQYHACARDAVDRARGGDKAAALHALEVGGDCTAMSESLMDACFALFDVIHKHSKP